MITYLSLLANVALLAHIIYMKYWDYRTAKEIIRVCKILDRIERDAE